uniref:DUS-like FMN-binding domain-containing protein n=1 Tax=Ditylenchus dipsaci TaxID=166011 RepID=A0A915E7K1_9BILA
MSAKNTVFYSSCVALSPMVKAGRTPLRVLSLEYGADLVYTEEIVDEKLLKSTRVVNKALNTIDYTLRDEIVLRIAKEENGKCVLQIGTNSAIKAAEICKKFDQDVDAIDVNMGCPKVFSTHNGMGAALLTQPDNVRQILTAMTDVSSVPISCKIRVLNDHEKTMEFAKMVQNCGISGLGIHGRRKDERPSHANRIQEIREIAKYLDIPVIANGCSSMIKKHSDIHKLREECGSSSIMLATRVLSNPSIFRQEGLLTMTQEIENFLDKACEWDESYVGTKYVVQRILGSAQEFDERGRASVAAGDVIDICRPWGKESKYLECKQGRLGIQNSTQLELINGVYVGPIRFAQKKLQNCLANSSPKCVLNLYCDELDVPRPEYSHYKTR